MTSPDEYNRRVLSELVDIKKTLGRIEQKLSAGGGTATGQRSGGAVASDSDLDGNYGDPTIKYMPKEKYWTGADFTGYKLSETSPDFLDAYAKYLDACAYGARKDGDERKAGFKEKDAGRARGWAARLRNGWRPADANARGPAGGSPSGESAVPSDYNDGAYDSGAGFDDVPFARFGEELPL